MNNILTYSHTEISANSIHKVLRGEARVNIFDFLKLGDITNDVRLLHAYQKSGARNISQFLAKGEDRMRIRNYGKGSEEILHAAIRSFIRDNRNRQITLPGSRIQAANVSSCDTNATYQEVLNSDYPEMILSELEWREWRFKFNQSEYLNDSIYYACLEAKLTWPIQGRWVVKKFRDYTNSSMTDLLGAKNFGVKKLRILIKSFAYLLAGKRKTVLAQSAEKRIEWLQDTIPLNEREKKIVHGRLEELTLQQIGDDLNLSRERIRQLQFHVLFKYRSKIGLDICSEFLDEKQQSIWNRAAKGKSYLPKISPLGIDDLSLSNDERFALFIYAGDRIKDERFSSIISDFFNRRFKQITHYWIDLPYHPSSIEAAIKLVDSEMSHIESPIAFKELCKNLPDTDSELLSIAVQLSNNICSSSGDVTDDSLTLERNERSRHA